MTVPQYALKISNIFRREGTRQPSVNIPSDGIFVDVPPCIPIILFISYDSVVIGFLPDLFVGHGTYEKIDALRCVDFLVLSSEF